MNQYSHKHSRNKTDDNTYTRLCNELAVYKLTDEKQRNDECIKSYETKQSAIVSSNSQLCNTLPSQLPDAKNTIIEMCELNKFKPPKKIILSSDYNTYARDALNYKIGKTISCMINNPQIDSNMALDLIRNAVINYNLSNPNIIADGIDLEQNYRQRKLQHENGIKIHDIHGVKDSRDIFSNMTSVAKFIVSRELGQFIDKSCMYLTEELHDIYSAYNVLYPSGNFVTNVKSRGSDSPIIDAVDTNKSDEPESENESLEKHPPEIVHAAISDAYRESIDILDHFSISIKKKLISIRINNFRKDFSEMITFDTISTVYKESHIYKCTYCNSKNQLKDVYICFTDYVTAWFAFIVRIQFYHSLKQSSSPVIDISRNCDDDCSFDTFRSSLTHVLEKMHVKTFN